jgi:hypothetical protein
MPTHPENPTSGVDPSFIEQISGYLARIMNQFPEGVEGRDVHGGVVPGIGPGGPARGMAGAARAIRPHPSPARRAAEGRRYENLTKQMEEQFRRSTEAATPRGMASRVGGTAATVGAGGAGTVAVGGHLEQAREDRITAPPPRPQETRRTGQTFVFRDREGIGEEPGVSLEPTRTTQRTLNAPGVERRIPNDVRSRIRRLSTPSTETSEMIQIDMRFGTVDVPLENLLHRLPPNLTQAFTTRQGTVRLEGVDNEVLQSLFLFALTADELVNITQREGGPTTGDRYSTLPALRRRSRRLLDGLEAMISEGGASRNLTGEEE